MYRTLSLLSFSVVTACVGNQPPDGARILIGPDNPTTVDDLEVAITYQSKDPDEDTVSYTYAWFSNGSNRPDIDGPTVPASETAKGDIWRVIVTPTDGTLDGPQVIESISIENSPPRVEASLSPAAPSTEEDLVVEVSTSDFDELDVVNVSYDWRLNGEPTAFDESTLSAQETSKGELWEVIVTPEDSEDAGQPVTLAAVVGNTAPVMNSIAISPAVVYTVSTIVAVAKAEDIDGDAVAFNYAWGVDGVVVQEGQNPSLAGSFFERGQEISLTVTPTDGYVDGASMQADTLVVANTPPTLTSAAITPSLVYTDTAVSCESGVFADADGDVEDYDDVQWVVNSVLVATGSSLDTTLFSKGDSIVCWMIPHDGTEAGAMVASEPVVVANTAPSYTSAALSTTSPAEGETLVVTTQGGTDIDGDTILNSVVWSINGIYLPTGLQATLNSSLFGKGDTIYALVQPTDGTDNGVAVQSDTAVVVNTPPEVSNVTIAPTLELYTDSIVNPVVTASDADGDTITYELAWSVNGVTVSDASVLYGQLFFDRDDLVGLEVTPHDGEVSGTAVSMDTAVVVVNKPPETPGVGIEPSTAVEGVDDLICTHTDAGDADGDTVTHTIVWRGDGAIYTDAIESDVPGDTVPAADTVGVAEWTCHVTPHDGFESGDYGTAVLTY